MDSFKSRLEFYMLKNGLNPTSLSKKARLNVTAVRDILQHNGTPNPRIDTFVKLCRALDVNPYNLLPALRELCSLRLRRLLDKAEQLDERDQQSGKENQQKEP
jgi:hypothetical protein